LSGSAANTYTGKTTVSGGTLVLNKNGVNAISSTGASGTSVANTDLQITGGIVRLESSNQIVDTAKVGLSGGTLALNGVSEGTTAAAGAGVGALTVSANSIIDLAGTSVLHFASSSTVVWSGTLSVYDYSGTVGKGNAAEQLLFGSNGSGLPKPNWTPFHFIAAPGQDSLERRNSPPTWMVKSFLSRSRQHGSAERSW
jgi:autotransporter-associated beta strand protein